MPDRDLAIALAGAPEPLRTWYHLGAYGGLRCCEIARLRGEDYFRRQGLLVIREQKGGDQDVIGVADVLAEVLAKMPAEGWWFVRWDGVPEPIAAGQLSRYGNRWLHENGIRHTMHSLRHWHGTNVYRLSGGDLRLTQEALRHKTPVPTAGYTLVDKDHATSVLARLPRFDAAVIPGE